MYLSFRLDDTIKNMNQFKDCVCEVQTRLNDYVYRKYGFEFDYTVDSYADNDFPIQMITKPVMCYDQEFNKILIHRGNLFSEKLTFNDLCYYLIHEISHYVDIKLNGNIDKRLMSDNNGHRDSFNRILKELLNVISKDITEVKYENTHFGQVYKIPKFKCETKKELMKRLFLTKEESERQRREHPSKPENMLISGIGPNGEFVSW